MLMSDQNHVSNRPTIGMLIDLTDSQYQFGILQGVSDFAIRQDINLICLEGGALVSHEYLKYDRNILYGLPCADRLDGLIILSDSIAIRLTDEALFHFRESFQPLPVVFVGRGHPKVHSIVIDSYTGMKEMMLHLIELHGYRRFAFIKGMQGSFHAEMRYKAFVEALQSHNIAIDEDFIYDGDFLERSGTLAVRKFIAVKKKLPDVIVACNDEMAISALHELKSCGIKVPEEVAVVGVDDIPKCATTSPAMTSVRQPLLREGWAAMALMLDILKANGDSTGANGSIPMVTTLDSRLIIRESCGCSLALKSPSSSLTISDKDGISVTSDQRVDQCRKQIGFIVKGISFDRNWMDDEGLTSGLINTYLQSCSTHKVDLFLDFWIEFLNKNFHLEVDEVIIGGLLQHLRKCIEIKDGSFIGDSLFWTALSILEKQTLQLLRTTNNTSWREELYLNTLRDQLDIRFNQNRIIDILYRNLVELGIRSAYMALYSQSEDISEARMVMAYTAGERYQLPDNGFLFPSRLLIPDQFFNGHERFSFMVEALYYDEQQIGFLMLDMSHHINSVHAGIRRIVCNILGSIDLVKKIEQQKIELVNSIGTLKVTLEGIIKTLSLTVENRDPYTAGHQRRVAELSIAIGREMNLLDDQLEELRVAALLHDIGKIYIPAEILNKPGKLKNIEFDLIKLHAEEGYNTLKNIAFPWPIAEIVYQHHERYDGSGYPRGLDSRNLLLAARILCVADVVEAITSMRPYRAALGLEVAIKEISQYKGTKYDPDVVDAALRLFQSKDFIMPTL
jgi:putative nucleotidyltransferase with HDIG domain